MFLNLRARSAKFRQNMPFYIWFHLIKPFKWFSLPLSNNLHGQKQLRKILKWGHCVFWAPTFDEICYIIESTESLLNKESFKPFFNQNCQCHLVIIIGETGASVYLSWSRLKFAIHVIWNVLWILTWTSISSFFWIVMFSTQFLQFLTVAMSICIVIKKFNCW